MFKLLVFTAVFLLFIQDSLSKEIKPHLQGEVKALVHFKQDKGIKDIWNNVKNYAKNLWIAVKTIAQNTKDRIKDWIDNVKNRSKEIRADFEQHLKDLKEKTKIIIEKVLGTGLLVKECMQENEESIDLVIKDILKRMMACISEEISLLSHLDGTYEKLELNETNFMNEVEEKLNECFNEEIDEECLLNKQKAIFEDTQALEKYILSKRTESRNIVDDLLDAIMKCSLDGLLEASGSIANETITIVACVIKG